MSGIKAVRTAVSEVATLELCNRGRLALSPGFQPTDKDALEVSAWKFYELSTRAAWLASVTLTPP